MAAQQLRQMIAKLAGANSRVLISGPPGSGKETVARLIHHRLGAGPQRVRGDQRRRDDAGTNGRRALRQEGEGGRPAKIGVFERAHAGTLYLDDVADMPRETQGRILRVLVEQRFRRVDGDSDVQVDVRVVSSTSRDLREEIAAGRFREDLFHRLNVVPVNVPGLSERREDIPDLVEYFIQRICDATGMPRRRLADDALATLQVAPGRATCASSANNVERMLILASGSPAEPITADMLPAEATVSDQVRKPGRRADDRPAAAGGPRGLEREYLNAQMLRFSGNISRTAAFIGMERSALHRKLKSLGLSGARALDEEVA